MNFSLTMRIEEDSWDTNTGVTLKLVNFVFQMEVRGSFPFLGIVMQPSDVTPAWW